MSMYQFKEQDAYDFAGHIRAKTQRRGDELHFYYCPYCNGGSRKDKNTFSINLKTGQFNCLRSGCGVTGNLVILSKDFDFSLGTEVDEYYRPQRKHKTFGKRNPEKPIQPRPKAVEYLAGRGISEEVARKYEITTRKDADNILVFPFYDDKGNMSFIKYRKTDFDKSKDNNKEWCEAGGRPILFGMNQCNLENKTLIVTEGQIDSLSVATAGFENAVSIPTGARGFTFIPYCWDWMCQFNRIIIFGDLENGSMSLLDDFRRRFQEKVSNVRPEDYQGCKDANEILQKYGAEQIRHCIENAEQKEINRVIPLENVVNVNPYDIPKMKTGIWELDRLLYGGLPFGLVHILAGSEGDGKSTFASQMLVNAVSQGLDAFIYSGEMPAYMVKSWIDFQIAGSHHIRETTNEFGDVRRFITTQNMELITSWYAGKIHLYDENAVNEEAETEYLLRTVEESIKRYNTRFILLDNLMTGIYADDDVSSEREENQMQIKFVMRLRKIAKTYDVLILLLVHKSKAGVFNNNPNNAISGSKKITNIAGIVMTYDRPTESEIMNDILTEDQRKLIVSKNRIFGKRNMKGIVLSYDEKSKRIYGERDDVNRTFGWEITEDGFMQLDINTETPFD